MEHIKNIGKKLTCHLCKYKWNFTGQLMRATCPSCNAKVKVKK